MLPELPKKNKKREADFGLSFRKWIERNGHKYPSVDFELKDSRGKDYISYSEITEDQVSSALRSASDKGHLVRNTVSTVGNADYSWKRHMRTFLVIRFPKSCEVITMDNFLAERDSSKRKSLTAERAKAISVTSF